MIKKHEIFFTQKPLIHKKKQSWFLNSMTFSIRDIDTTQSVLKIRTTNQLQVANVLLSH